MNPVCVNVYVSFLALCNGEYTCHRPAVVSMVTQPQRSRTDLVYSLSGNTVKWFVILLTCRCCKAEELLG